MLALAVNVGAPTIATENLKDFPAEMCGRFDVEAISSDTFPLAQVHLHRDDVLAASTRWRPAGSATRTTRPNIIERLRAQLPAAMAALD